ncbi:hypothetical protein [Actinomycetospora straminea]|uniref:VIT family protein n=1 Tax=Actinomycetospora straminea TaxID=663607 RepID=A0ABP9E5G2_9PSEU|nr:hypothetical protein [Actinomycetospora straminea]MDD7932742.1 hypothetical protein [Actinomycetospora straminea]
MATTNESDEAVSSRSDLGPVARAHLRSALTGSIFAMSVLAYLGDHDTALVTAVVTVAGTGIVIFLGEAYAGLLSTALASERKVPRAEVRHEISASSMAAAPGVLAGAFLLLADLLGLSVPTAVDIGLWLGVLTLTGLSLVEAHGSHRSVLVRVGSVVGSVLVGVAIIVLKAQLH